ncbi:MAG: divalent-cation tolerance protein CutA [Candidatus Aminicenantes bacterium]
MTEYILVLTTVPDEDVAERITQNLVAERLAACVTRTMACQSAYWWQGKISRDEEHILFIKTQAERYSELEKKLLALHPYDVPEVIAIPLAGGYAKYLEWLKEETARGSSEGI